MRTEMSDAAAVQDEDGLALRNGQQGTGEIVRRKIDLQHGVDSSMQFEAVRVWKSEEQQLIYCQPSLLFF